MCEVLHVVVLVVRSSSCNACQKWYQSIRTRTQVLESEPSALARVGLRFRTFVLVLMLDSILSVQESDHESMTVCIVDSCSPWYCTAVLVQRSVVDSTLQIVSTGQPLLALLSSSSSSCTAPLPLQSESLRYTSHARHRDKSQEMHA